MTNLPPLRAGHSALFLDFDGTLADLASRPDAVRVPPDLPDLLDAWHQRLGGALAIVTGRARDDLTQWLPTHRWPGAFEHGAVRVGADGIERTQAGIDLSPVAAAAQAFAARHAGLLVEIKKTSLALHYRLNPALGTACVDMLARAIDEQPGLRLMHGKAVVEVKAADAGKGKAIEAFMNESPFLGRQPWFAGDDVTDEDGFDVVASLGGASIKVGDGPTRAHHRCTGPTALRTWLRRALESDT
ncbi:MAG: trehalose-phosphatase [Hydrogenophaga sp.]|uniref:trehalose-phosphatase n=1 Tax=Hydrogenophaga sp. TaxID=1904254 RepID=UPI001D43900C|nr:trehalose-phosphatase [Hydrogenophaga sp.]MBX3611134.1 trehalose-phosphatase [Hydrogenophaga sp.]